MRKVEPRRASSQRSAGFPLEDAPGDASSSSRRKKSADATWAAEPGEPKVKSILLRMAHLKREVDLEPEFDTSLKWTRNPGFQFICVPGCSINGL